MSLPLFPVLGGTDRRDAAVFVILKDVLKNYLVSFGISVCVIFVVICC